ncbi:MAG: sigma-70 family RNA polymerase sigma factor [Bacillota bacterium]|nr:sigma-70 family RNA polymerase sigma factor [Bacillota bacterium]
MDPAISDVELINRCIKGDQDAFSEIVSRYKRLVFKVVFNIINNEHEVNDISQEVFLKVYKNLRSYNPEYKFSTWIVKVATNHCLDTVRKKKVDSLSIEEAADVSDKNDTPEESYIRKEKVQRIREAISELPEKYRVPIILFHQNGLSYEEMMKVMNEPITIIKNRLYRARLMLKGKLIPEGKEGTL